MKAITSNTVIPNPGFIGARDLLIANDEKQIPHRLRRFRNDMPHDMRR